MKVKKKLKLKKLSSTNIWYVVDIMSIFCSREIGVNKRKKKDLIYYLEKRDHNEPKLHGFYDPDDNEIRIFTKRNKTLDEFIKTFIHEYTHYLQPCKTQYTKLLDTYGYENHPFEIEAYANEDKYFKQAYKEVKRLLSLT